MAIRPVLAIKARQAPARWAFLKFNIGLMGKIRQRRKNWAVLSL
jgi:hypothetical protein